MTQRFFSIPRGFDRMTGLREWFKQRLRWRLGAPQRLMRYERKTPMAEHKHGEQDVTTQEKVFAGFVRYTVWGAAISIGILVFLALFNS